MVTRNALDPGRSRLRLRLRVGRFAIAIVVQKTGWMVVWMGEVDVTYSRQER